MSRYLKIVAHSLIAASVFARYLLLHGLAGRSGSAAAFRLALQSLGVNWIKFGQALSLRFDLFPADFCRELLRIENRIQRLPSDEISRVIRDQLGAAPEQLFASFEPVPFAVTSSGQLHEARSHDGTRLVVMVQHPRLIEEFAIQSAVMPMIAAVLDHLATRDAGGNLRRAVADFLDQRAAELSFAVRTINVRKMTSLAGDDPGETNIRIRDQYSAAHILCWDHIDGVPVSDIIGRPAGRAAAFDLRRIAHTIYRNALNQMFRDGIYHADISAAGLLVLHDDSIGYVDFAVIGRPDDERLKQLQAIYKALLRGEVDAAADRLIEAADVAASFDDTTLRRALVTVLEDRLDGFESATRSLPRRLAENTYQRLMSAFWQSDVALPDDLSMYLRTMMTLEALVFELCPEFDAVAEQRRFHKLAAREDFRQSAQLPYAVEQIAYLYQDAVDLMSDLRTLHNSARTIDVSLRTLRIRLLQYGFWAALAAVGTYFVVSDESLRIAEALRGALLLGTLFIGIFLFNRLWRQTRQLSRVDRALVSTGEVSGRSFGRVR